MAGVGLGLGSSVCWGISDFLGGLMARRISATVVLYAGQFFGLAFALGGLALFAGDGLAAGELAAAVGAGAFATLALGAFYRALAIGPISVVATLSALGVMVPVVAGLAQGESPTAVQAFGIALAAAGGVLVAREPGGGFPHANREAVLLAVVASVGFGLFFVAIDAAASSDAAWAVFSARAGGVAMLLIALPILRPRLGLMRGALAPLASIGFFDVSANALFAIATTFGLLSLVSPAASLYAAVTVVLARIFLGERVARARVVAIVAALAGVVLIASQS